MGVRMFRQHYCRRDGTECGAGAAAEGLGTCVRASVDHDAFGEADRLQDGQTILLAQTLGVLL